jgi:hypothetical protein
MTDLVRRKRAGEAWETIPDPDAPGGNIQTATISTDPDTFTGTHTLDLVAGASAMRYEVVITALDGDGETFGSNSGDLILEVIASTSDDQVTWGNPASGAVLFVHPDMNVLDATTLIVSMAARYVRVVVNVTDFDSGDPYSGPNHPTATVEVTIAT